MEILLQGIGVSPGIAIGPALGYGVRALDVPKHAIDDVAGEQARFRTALAAAGDDLRRLRAKVEAGRGAKEAAIFNVHVLMLEDPSLVEEVEARIAQERVNAEIAVDEFVRARAEIMASVNDPMFSERAIDFTDIGRRIVEKLMNIEAAALSQIDRPSVIVAHDLTPSDTANLDLPNTLAITTDLGGATSHTAILARAFELPAVVGLKRIGTYAYPGDVIIVDGSRGKVIVRPAATTLKRYEELKQREDARRVALTEAAKNQRSVTLDDVEITLQANLELPNEVDRALDVQAEGVGLFRTEYLYLNRDGLPSEEEQYTAYRLVAEAMKPHPVTFRTLDIGGDKIVAGIHDEVEPNPQLGWRAIRFCLERVDIFRAQLRALYRASVHGNIKIMFPLISGVDELRRVKTIVCDVQDELDEDGISFRRDVPLGVMIEVPSAVAVADHLAKECDFFSIGTNDLVQYALAVDRVNERIAHMFEQAHPAVFRMLRDTVQAAKKANIPVNICGEMAGNPIFTEALIGLGVTSLSMSPVSIPEIRSIVASSRLNMAMRFANKILDMGSIPEIKAQLRRRYDNKQNGFWSLSQFDRSSLDGDLEGAEAHDADEAE